MNRGSEWRIWDLHLHTPSSYDYKDGSVTNEDIVAGLVASGVSAVAITDHYVIDVPRIKELQTLGKLHNLSIFPGIEFCSELGGSESVHFIGIFAENSDIENIWTKIQGQCNLTKADIDAKGGYEHICCEFVKTCNIILELGGIVTVHAGKKSNSLESIKNNLLVKQELKQDLLSRFRPLLDVGKIEDIGGYRTHVFPEIKFSLPIIMCSDNHDIKNYQVKEKMWIKAQPTFEGLKQILYEPEDRVRIQTTKPDDKNRYQVIDSVTLSEEGFWNDTIYFNQNLNTIIGGRSTGKSSLLKAIAAKHGSVEVELDDFVRDHLGGVSINWMDGNDQVGREIDYFKQSYMHDIASDAKKTNALVETIIRSKDTSGVYSKYDERLRDTERVITSDLFNLFQMQKEHLKKQDELKALGKQDGVQQQIEILKSKIADLQKGSAITLEEQTNFELQQAKIKECVHLLEQAEADVNVFKSIQTLTPFIYNFEEQHALNTLSFGLNGSEFAREFKNLKIATESQFSNLVLKYIDSTQTAMGKLAEQKRTILESEAYKKGLANIEGNKELKDINLRLSAEEKKLKEILLCQSQIDALNKKLSELFDKVIENHCLFRLYADDVVKESSISYDGLAIRVQRHHHQSQLKMFLENRLNQRGNERQGYLSRFVDNYDSDNKGNISDILNQLLNGSLQLKNGYDAYNVASELLAKSWYSLSYELSYQGDLFNQMSEGKQAFVILKLLLDFSDKKCPILIDQPEDSLDNRAIYNELVTYIRKKKVERQIILVTHNPNVVVSADSENVIVANQEGTSCHNSGRTKFQYINGALEETRAKNNEESIILASQGIREHVCDILEGGRVAFEKREQKYGFK